MTSILTFDELKRYNSSILNEAANLIKTSALGGLRTETSLNTVFLSYSSKDSELIPFIIKVLRGHGGLPYIDKGDERLPKPPSVETAKVLKDTIKVCKRLVVFVTTNSKESKWVPWELGLGDGAKNNYDIAIFPTAENAYETSWIDQEYLGLYSRIVWGRMVGYEKEIWMVYDHKNHTATSLDKWLK
jgi:hypothetical protein